jgi:serine/threonine protein kinase
VHQGKAFLIDFGFSQQAGEKGNFVGAPGFIAPELLYSLDGQNVTSASDIWSYSGQIEKVRQALMEKMRSQLAVLETRIEEIRETLNDKTDPLKLLLNLSFGFFRVKKPKTQVLRNRLSLHPAERLIAQDIFDRLNGVIVCK